jgi:hypothetical protein
MGTRRSDPRIPSSPSLTCCQWTEKFVNDQETSQLSLHLPIHSMSFNAVFLVLLENSESELHPVEYALRCSISILAGI